MSGVGCRGGRESEGLEMQSYKDLIAYQKGYELSLSIYKATEDFPKEEIYGLISQIRRCAVSIPCNIAEGYRRNSIKEYVQFLHIAQGSCSELETLLSLSKDLEMIPIKDFEKLYALQDDVSRLLRNLIIALKGKYKK